MAGSLAAVRDYLDRGRGLAQDGITEKSPVCARVQASICLPKRGISCSVKNGNCNERVTWKEQFKVLDTCYGITKVVTCQNKGRVGSYGSDPIRFDKTYIFIYI